MTTSRHASTSALPRTVGRWRPRSARSCDSRSRPRASLVIVSARRSTAGSRRWGSTASSTCRSVTTSRVPPTFPDDRPRHERRVRADASSARQARRRMAGRPARARPRPHCHHGGGAPVRRGSVAGRSPPVETRRRHLRHARRGPRRAASCRSTGWRPNATATSSSSASGQVGRSARRTRRSQPSVMPRPRRWPPATHTTSSARASPSSTRGRPHRRADAFRRRRRTRSCDAFPETAVTPGRPRP